MTSRSAHSRNRFQPAIWWLWPLAAGLVLAAHLWFPPLEDAVLHDTYSTTADGQRAFYRLMSDHAEWSSRNTQPLQKALPDSIGETLCILGPERWPTDAEWTAILDWVKAGGQLVLACRGATERAIPQLNIKYLPRGGGTPDDSLPPQTSLLSEGALAWWTDGRLLAPGAEVLLSYDGTPQVVKQQWGEGRVVVSASALPFSNQLLTYGDNPLLAFRLVESAGELWSITFDESLNTSGTPKSMAIFFDNELRPLTLQLMLLLILYAWWNCCRFGPFLPPSVGARHDIVEHADALGSAYWRCRDGGAVLTRFLQALRTAPARTRLDPKNLAAWSLAAQRLGQPVRELQEEWTRAEALASVKHLDRRTAARTIRRLMPLRRALTQSTAQAASPLAAPGQATRQR